MTIEFAPFRGEVAALPDGHDQVSWRDEMAGYLVATSFPGRQDELLSPGPRPRAEAAAVAPRSAAA